MVNEVHFDADKKELRVVETIWGYTLRPGQAPIEGHIRVETVTRDAAEIRAFFQRGR